MKKVTNTENDPRPDWLFGMNPRAIENQEAEGQKELIESQQLPRVCKTEGIVVAEQYHKMGIQVLTPSKGDGDLFFGVKLPVGWRKEATDHHMWSDLLDDKNRIRASIFYKAAFYDRDAFIRFKTRYYVEYNFLNEKDDNNNQLQYVEVKDAATPNDFLWRSEKHVFMNYDKFWKEAEAWLAEKAPDYEDINAYWE